MVLYNLQYNEGLINCFLPQCFRQLSSNTRQSTLGNLKNMSGVWNRCSLYQPCSSMLLSRKFRSVWSTENWLSWVFGVRGRSDGDCFYCPWMGDALCTLQMIYYISVRHAAPPLLTLTSFRPSFDFIDLAYVHQSMRLILLKPNIYLQRQPHLVIFWECLFHGPTRWPVFIIVIYLKEVLSLVISTLKSLTHPSYTLLHYHLRSSRLPPTRTNKRVKTETNKATVTFTKIR